MDIKIEWIEDRHDCETCGLSYAEGAIVHLDDGRTLEFIPNAYCYDSTSYNRMYVYAQIMAELGCTIDEIDIPYASKYETSSKI